MDPIPATIAEEWIAIPIRYRDSTHVGDEQQALGCSAPGNICHDNEPFVGDLLESRSVLRSRNMPRRSRRAPLRLEHRYRGQGLPSLYGPVFGAGLERQRSSSWRLLRGCNYA